MIGLAIRAIAIIAALAAIAYAWHRFVEHYREQGRAEVRAEWDADKARRIALTTGIVMDATKRFSDEYEIAQQRRAILDRDFSVLEAAAGSLNSGRGVSIPAAAARLRDDAARAANADRPKVAGADSGGKAGADAVPDAPETAILVYDEREWAAYEIAGPKAYRDAYQLWAACRAREDTCRAVTNKLLGGSP